MGGFILAKQDSNKFNPSNALKIFQEKEMTISKDISVLNYKLHVYNKKSFSNQNFFHFDEDIIVSTGTPIYKKLTGENAAQELYFDYKKNNKIDFNDFNGHYCYLIFINKDLLIFNDYNGVYHVYHDGNMEIFSTSFLAISAALDNKSICKQGLYEYLFYGATYGSDTLLNEIKRMDSKNIIQLTPKFISHSKNFKKDNINSLNFNEFTDYTSEKLKIYFKTITNNFDRFSLGLSGGFDSRLILSLLLDNNVLPLIYTSGSPNSLEVNISRKICNDLGLDFKNYHEGENVELKKPFDQFIHEKFLNDEGFTYGGTFSSSLNMDFEISQTSKINLNGGGGEIYREFWKLPARNIKIEDFLKVKFKDFSLDIVKDKFSEKIFFDGFGRKICDSLDLEMTDSKLNNILIELIYPNFRLKYWTGPGCKKINQFSYALIPFAEPLFYFDSIYIPLKYRIAGKFEAALIKKINPQLAKYESNYGFNFFDGPGLKEKVADWIKIYTPLTIRPLLRRIKSENLVGLSKLKEKSKIIFNEPFVIDQYINRDKVKNIEIYSRLLTVEYFLKYFLLKKFY